MSTHDGHDAPTHCENCATPLQGHYCHACGQSMINPVRHAAHALEEVFEAFWHLDGRIFRTLRDLLSPGRVAINYLAGQRARYVAPLRLFVILSVLTFFVAQFAIRVDSNPDGNPLVQLDDDDFGPPRPDKAAKPGETASEKQMRRDKEKQDKRFDRAESVAEVEKVRSASLADLAEAREAIPAMLPHARKAIDVAIEDVNRTADRRIEALRVEQKLSDADIAAAKLEAAKKREADEASKSAVSTLEKAKDLAEVERLRDERLAEQMKQLATVPANNAAERNRQWRLIRNTNTTAGCRAAQLQITHATNVESGSGRTRKAIEDERIYGSRECDGTLTLFGNNDPWDEETNPVVISWAPAFLNHWLNRQIAHGKENVARAQNDPSLYVRALLAAVPSALFLLVPVFALLLKLAYVGSGRLYLEHLVVALYSHAFMVLLMLALFLLVVLDHAIAPHWSGFGWISGLVMAALWVWLPVYLWLMQKRVYRNGWLLTTVRYLIIGNLYFVLLTFAAVGIALASLVRM